jgi:rubredoxin
MTAPVRSPALFRCRPCGHVWPALWTPLESSRAIRAMKGCCPACGEPKALFMATKEEAAIWAGGPRGEPCFVERPTP